MTSENSHTPPPPNANANSRRTRAVRAGGGNGVLLQLPQQHRAGDPTPSGEWTLSTPTTTNGRTKGRPNGRRGVEG